MGKDKKKKTGKGATKTAEKTEKKMTKKVKKFLATKGEEDIEKILQQIEEEEKKRSQVTEKVCEPPSIRANFSFIPHSDNPEIILFGGEYFNGQKTIVYSDLFIYNVKRKEWRSLKSPGGPPPRCGHQAVCVSQSGGQLWVFGGEFSSTSQNQFHHYSDLWVLHFSSRRWEKIKCTGGPSARSGHRMIHMKRKLFVFGGFHDNLRDYRYFNDIYAFDMDSMNWISLEITGSIPSPRSGCQMMSLPDGKILMYGGYSKEKLKKDVDKGITHADLYVLTPDKNVPNKYKWGLVKQHGVKPSPRCGFSLGMCSPNKGLFFGGVFDDEDEEEINGYFFNELYSLTYENDKAVWHKLETLGKRDPLEKKVRRKLKESEEIEEIIENNANEDNEEIDAELEIDKLTIDDSSAALEEVKDTVVIDGVFTITTHNVEQEDHVASCSQTSSSLPAKVFTPSKRFNCGLAVKQGKLFLYGGMLEDGDKQLTLSDFYSIDIHKFDEWETIIENNLEGMEWFDSDSETDSALEDDASKSDSDEDDDEDEN